MSYDSNNFFNFRFCTIVYSRYYDYLLSVNGQGEEHGKNYEIDYLTDVMSRKALDWLKDRRDLKDQNGNENVSPFLMVLAPPAPHAPSTSAPQYENEFLDRKVPRNPTFNYVKNGNRDKHWLMRYKDNFKRKNWFFLNSIFIVSKQAL